MLNFLNFSIKFVIIFLTLLVFFVFSTLWYFSVGLPDYKKLSKVMPKSIDWAKLSEYEKVDTTASSQTFACTGDVCEIVDIGA